MNLELEEEFPCTLLVYQKQMGSSSMNILYTSFIVLAKNGILTSVGDSNRSSVEPIEPTETWEKPEVLAKEAKIVAASPDGRRTVSLGIRFPATESNENL